MRRQIAGILILIASLLLVDSLYALDYGVRAGRFDDLEENMVGVEVAFELGRFIFNPNFEWILIDEMTAMSLNADFLYPIAQWGRATPYLGLGLGALHLEARGFGSEDEFVGNAIAGLAFETAKVKPYVQIKHFRLLEATAAYDTALTLGIRIRP